MIVSYSRSNLFFCSPVGVGWLVGVSKEVKAECRSRGKGEERRGVLKLGCIVRRWGGGRVLRLTAADGPCREALVELAFADKANAVAVGVVNVME